MEKINVQVTVKGIYKYSKPSYNGFGYTDYRLYNMVAEDGTVYIWNTSSFFCEKFLDPENGWDIDSKGNKWNYSEINKNDVIEITASVKGQSEYKGQPQTELQRVKLVKRIVKAKTWDEIQAERKAEAEAKKNSQIESLQEGDFIWTMPYKQYKDHYSDCETVVGSFERDKYGCTISVIIREGRLKASGVRGKHYCGYQFVNELGERVVYRAVSEENALKRVQKEFPEYEWECNKIYNYQY